jgi:hypothetical protein
MDPRYERERLGAAAGVCDWPDQSRTTPQERIPGSVLKQHGIAPAPKRSQNTTWKEFIQTHLAVLAGIDFFTVEVLTWRGLVTYYVLFFIHLESRRVSLAGITRHPDQGWMQQMARNSTGEEWGFLEQRRYVLHERDTKFCSVFRDTLAGWWHKTDSTSGVKSEPECLCRKMGAIRKRRMLIEADLVRRSLITTGADRFHRSLSRRAKPPRER